MAPDALVTVTFSEPMAAGSLDEQSFLLEGPAGAVAGAVSTTGAVATFAPSAPLAPGGHRATITVAARDLAGNPLAAPLHVGFTVRAAAVDDTPPHVVAVSPVAGATDAPVDAVVRATFSEPLDCDAATAAAFTLVGEGAVQGALGCEGAQVSFTPAAPLEHLADYEATLSTAITDLAGNRLAAPYTWAFQTAPWVDTTPPTVVATEPAAAAIDIAVDTVITVQFSEPVDPATVTPQTFRVVDGAAEVAGARAVSSARVVFTPEAALEPGHGYAVTVSTGVRDLAGNALAAAVTWTFTTAAAVTPPSVLFVRYGNIYRVKEDGTGQVVIAGDSSSTEVFLGISASGRIVYQREADLFSVGPNGEDRVQLDSAWPGNLQFRGFSTNDRVVYAMNGDLFAIDPGGAGKVTLASTDADEADAVPASGGRVVYRTIPASGTDQALMSVRDDGAGTVTLDATPQLKIIAHLDAAGGLFYERGLAAYGGYQYDVLHVGLDGGGLTEIAATTTFSETFFAQASDGTVGLSTCQLPMCDASLFVVSGVTIDCGRGGPRGLTADDHFILSQGPLGAQDLLAVSTTGAAVPIAADPGLNEVFLAVHPEGRVIYRVFTSARQQDILSVRTDGTGQVTLAGTPAQETFLGVTPTGRVVWLIDVGSSPQSQLWSSHADGTDARLLRESSATLTFAGFSKAGKVAYFEALDPSRGADLYLVDHDGSPPVNLTQNPSTSIQSFIGSYP